MNIRRYCGYNPHYILYAWDDDTNPTTADIFRTRYRERAMDKAKALSAKYGAVTCYHVTYGEDGTTIREQVFALRNMTHSR